MKFPKWLLLVAATILSIIVLICLTLLAWYLITHVKMLLLILFIATGLFIVFGLTAILYDELRFYNYEK